jgi:hypothetical protein
LLSVLLTEDLIMYSNLLSTKFMKPPKWLYATQGTWAWVPPELRNKVLKPQVNRQMIRPTPKPWKVYDSRKQRCVENEGGSKSPLFALNYDSIHVITWIFIQNIWFQKEIFSFEKTKMKVGIECWNCLLNKSIVIVETKSH